MPTSTQHAIGKYSAMPMYANVADVAGSATLHWQPPTGDFTRLIIVASRLGVPDNPDREKSRRVLDVDYTPGSEDPNLSTTALTDTALTPGREEFYAMYAWGTDAEVTGGYRWYLAGYCSVLLPVLHHSADALRAMLPAAAMTSEASIVSGPEEPDSVLYNVAGAIGETMDYLRTDVDRFTDIYDPTRCPSALVPYVGATLGIEGESALPMRASRDLNRYAVRIFTSKGTSTAIRLMTEALSGLDAQVTTSKNRIPTPFLSGFEHDADDVVTGTVVSAPTVVSTVVHEVWVDGCPGYPVSAEYDPASLAGAPVLAELSNATTTQHVLLLNKKSTSGGQSKWTLIPGAKKTLSTIGDFGAGSVLSVNANGTGWTASNGYVARTVPHGGDHPAHPPYTATTEAEQLFPPLMERCLLVENVSDIPYVLLMLGPWHNIIYAEKYDGADTLLVTEHNHSFQPGDVIEATITGWSLSATPLTVTEVVDQRRIRVSHRGTAFAVLDQSSATSQVDHQIFGPDHARVMPAVPDEFYTFSFWAYSDGTTTLSPAISFFDKDMAYTDEYRPDDFVISGWTHVVLTASTPEAATCYAGVYVLGTTDSLFYVDNAQFELASDASKYADGGNIVVQLATSVTTDPDTSLRRRLKDRLSQVTAAGRTHTILLSTDTALGIAANGVLSLTYDPLERYFRQADPETVTALDQEAIYLTESPDVTYVPAYDPEAVSRAGGRDLLEFVFRADITATGSAQVIANQKSGLDPATDDVWKLSVVLASPTTATLTFVVNNADTDPAHAITLSATVPYSAGTSRWYRARLVATESSGNFKDGAEATLAWAPDATSEPEAWTTVGTTSKSVGITDMPGDIRIGDASAGAAISLRHARLGRVAEFSGADYDDTTKTAINPYGSFEAAYWTYSAP